MVSFEELIARWTLEAEAERLATIARNWDYYEGRHRKTLRVARDGVDDNIVVNFVRLAVDKTVSCLFGKEIFFQVGGKEPDPFTDYLEAVFQRNRKMTFLQRLALSGAVAGHFFIQIQPEGDLPRLVLLDPATVSILVNPDDIDQVIGFRI
ncbi:phage portal protein, partial [Thermoflexus sp.]|uniref:phage portal protein n=1 Tax=Thermoflexus sp. TaxID=1969742 RepID=UPI003C011120